ncbi:hypothetical protein V6N13_117039 [Hibiscus sabdariffa]|uniref:RING-type domain-containing protein n=1 Tax=Hibiscus sabdariffa TaxID=183260 RepID=A0ABR2QHQ9_9ROSI
MPPISVQAPLYFGDVAVMLVMLLLMLFLLLICLRNILSPENHENRPRAIAVMQSRDLENQLPADLVIDRVVRHEPSQNLQLVETSGPVTNATIVRYKSRGKIESRWTTDCVICLEEFKDGDSCSVLPNCKHLYHQFCIDQWLGRNRHCPLCRDSVRKMGSTIVTGREAASTE